MSEYESEGLGDIEVLDWLAVHLSFIQCFDVNLPLLARIKQVLEIYKKNQKKLVMLFKESVLAF